jgi:hypothetical protein
MLNHYKPEIFKQFPEVVAAQSTRHGGVSPQPFYSLNLGLSSGDLPENVYKNREIFFQSLGIEINQVTLAKQVHGDDILLAAIAGNYQSFDAIISSKKNLYVAVSVADCVPVLIYDSSNHAIAAIHAGWKGTVLQIVSKTIVKMEQEFGTKPNKCFAYIGTCIDECSFETDDDVAVHFPDDFKRFDSNRNKYLIDLKKANAKQLTDTGIPDNQIEISPFSTVLNNQDYFSHRLENGKTGRMMAVIGIKD